MSYVRSDEPELWAFLEALQPGVILSGVIASIRTFGVFVELDEGPRHPSFDGVGFITLPELAWQHFTDATEIVHVGQRVSCEFLMFDTWNLEARLSLRALQPDPFQAFADLVDVGLEMVGQVIEVVPFGVFVRVPGDVIGLVRGTDGNADVGDTMDVVVADINRSRRTLELRAR